jgi:ribosomal protein S18 acetylase RimI-like enzyme
MHGTLAVKSFAELEAVQLRQGVEIFVEGHYRRLSFLTTETDALVDVLEHSFVRDHYFAGILDDTVVGIAACSTDDTRSHRFDRKQFVTRLGLVKGLLGYRRLRDELEKPLGLHSSQCFIESVVTDTAFRGKGIATIIQEHLIEELPYSEYLLVVEKSNVAAIKLYEKLGFSMVEPYESQLPPSLSRKSDHIVMCKKKQVQH